MLDDKDEKLGPMFSEIGQEVVHMTGGNGDEAFLYVEIGLGWVGTSIFKDDGDKVRYIDTDDHRLCDLLFAAWYTEEPDKRWATMEYTIKDGKFDTTFKFPEEIDWDKAQDERRRRVLHTRYGDKPVVYPSWPRPMHELKQ